MKFSPRINNRKWQAIIIPVASLGVVLVMGWFQYLTKGRFNFSAPLFFILLVFTFIIWESNLFVYRRLDKKIPFYQNPQSRFIKQVLYGFLVTIFTFSLLFLLLTWFYRSPFNVVFYLRFLLIAIGISFAINGLYIYQYLKTAIYFREELKANALNEKIAELMAQTNNNQPAIIKGADAPPQLASSLLIEAGNKTFNILLTDIAWFSSADGMVILIKKDAQKLTTNYNSFKYITNRLPPQSFFQLNRQVITHLQSIRSVTDDVNRKLIVRLATTTGNLITEEITVSRYRNPEFKEWFTRQISTGR